MHCVRQYRYSNLEIFTPILEMLGGASVILTGLFAYFGNLRLEKYKADIEATNTKLSGFMESSVHVSKAQFDKEFSIYQQIWMLLVELRVKTLSLSPVMDYVDPDETEEERMQKRLLSFNEAFVAFRNGMEHNRPFYVHSVYVSLNQILKLCHTESIEYRYKKSNGDTDFWKKTIMNHQNIVDSIDSCCELIRDRISSLAVVR